MLVTRLEPPALGTGVGAAVGGHHCVVLSRGRGFAVVGRTEVVEEGDFGCSGVRVQPKGGRYLPCPRRRFCSDQEKQQKIDFMYRERPRIEGVLGCTSTPEHPRYGQSPGYHPLPFAHRPRLLSSWCGPPTFTTPARSRWSGPPPHSRGDEHPPPRRRSDHHIPRVPAPVTIRAPAWDTCRSPRSR